MNGRYYPGLLKNQWWIALVLCLLYIPLGAEQRVIYLDEKLDLDETGESLRRAFNAVEENEKSLLSPAWSKLLLRQGESIALGNNRYILLMESGSPAYTRIVYINEQGPLTYDLKEGEDTIPGDLELILVNRTLSSRTAEVLVRGASSKELLSDNRPEESRVEIYGEEDPDRLIVVSPIDSDLEFSSIFVDAMKRGKPPEEAARQAQKVIPVRPPVAPPVYSDVNSPQNPEYYVDPTNIFDQHPSTGQREAVVVIRSVSGSQQSIRQLTSSGSVTVNNGDVDINAHIRAGERSGNIQLESETMIRVSVPGGADINFNRRGGFVSAYLDVVPAGRGRVELSIDQASGNRMGYSSVYTRVRARDGETVVLAKDTFQQSSSMSSQVPLLGDVPFIGGAFRNESRRSVSGESALLATVYFDDNSN